MSKECTPQVSIGIRRLEFGFGPLNGDCSPLKQTRKLERLTILLEGWNGHRRQTQRKTRKSNENARE